MKRSANPATPPPEGALLLLPLSTLCLVCRKINKPMSPVVPTTGAEKYQCAKCGGAGHLVLVPSGDAALTRRVARLSPEVRLLVTWNARRKRWERRGTLVAPEAMAEAQAMCAMDEDTRAGAREKAQAREDIKDKEYVEEFAAAIRAQFPGLDPAVCTVIANHACEKHSGRVGRTAGAKQLDPDLVVRAVIAHARHLHTEYDSLRDVGMNKRDSRDLIRKDIHALLAEWRRPRTEALEAEG